MDFDVQSQMKAVSPAEEFECSLGVDPAVRVTYKPARTFNEETGFIMGKTHVAYTEQRIELKNTRSDDVKVTLHERVPISNDEKLKVKL